MYITHPTHGAGARPGKTQPPTATRKTTLNADQCVRQPRKGRGRNRQTPPQKKTGGGARERPTATKPPTNTTRGGQTPRPDGTEDRTPQRSTGGPPTRNRQHQAGGSGPPGEGTPKTRGCTPRWYGKKKQTTQPGREGMGGQRPRDPRRGQPATDTTKPPPQKKPKGREGGKPHQWQHPHTPAPQAAPQEGRGQAQLSPTHKNRRGSSNGSRKGGMSPGF